MGDRVDELIQQGQQDLRAIESRLNARAEAARDTTPNLDDQGDTSARFRHDPDINSPINHPTTNHPKRP